MIFSKYLIVAVTLLLISTPASASPKDFLKKGDAWFAKDEASRIGANIISFQSELGGWPKNTDTTSQPYTGDPDKLTPTYDNGATTDELRFLARLYVASQQADHRRAFELGFDYILSGQYENGGWPQRSPPGKGYHRHITFNDDAMVRLLNFVREVGTVNTYRFVDKTRRKAALEAFWRGIECILKCQIRVDGTLTSWCAQHDEIDFQPRPARSYELVSLSGAESVGIMRLLMSIEEPSPEIVRSVEASVAWFRRVMLTGIRIEKVRDKNGPHGFNLVVVQSAKAKPIWARFYDIKTSIPLFVDRDGIPKQSLADIGYERRNGYAWYGTWPQKLLDRDYDAWKKRIDAIASGESRNSN